MNHNRFTWDYPAEGTRFARTSAEAFGPYGMMPMSRRRNRVTTRLNYALAVLLAVAAAAVWGLA